MSFVSRGFRGRRREDADPSRVPPGQYVTGDFPVLSAGPTPHAARGVALRDRRADGRTRPLDVGGVQRPSEPKRSPSTSTA